MVWPIKSEGIPPSDRNVRVGGWVSQRGGAVIRADGILVRPMPGTVLAGVVERAGVGEHATERFPSTGLQPNENAHPICHNLHDLCAGVTDYRGDALLSRVTARFEGIT
jgi:hypothetical protein